MLVKSIDALQKGLVYVENTVLILHIKSGKYIIWTSLVLWFFSGEKKPLVIN